MRSLATALMMANLVTTWSPLHSDSPRLARRDRWDEPSDHAGIGGMESDGAPRPSATIRRSGVRITLGALPKFK